MAIGYVVAGVPGALLYADGPSCAEVAQGKVLKTFSDQAETQADRIGLEYSHRGLRSARSAPETWRSIARNHADHEGHVFWANPNQNFLRRTYLESELNIQYAGQDFSFAKKDSPEFHAAAAAIKATRIHGKKNKK